MAINSFRRLANLDLFPFFTISKYREILVIRQKNISLPLSDRHMARFRLDEKNAENIVCSFSHGGHSFGRLTLPFVIF